MLYWLLTVILTLIFDILGTIGVASNDKDLEIILLWQQVRILQRKVNAPPRLPHPEKLILATLTARFRHITAGARHRLDGAAQYTVKPSNERTGSLCALHFAERTGSVYCSSGPKQFSAGTGSWCAESGLTGSARNLVGPDCRRSWKS